MRPTIFVLALAGLTSCDQVGQDKPFPTGALLAANVAKEQAMIAGNPAALERFYTADYQVIDDDGEVHDKRNQVEFTTASMDLLSAASDDVTVDPLSDDAALVTGRLSGRYRMKGKEAGFVQRYTSIWVRQGKDWRVRHEHSSTMPDQR